MTDPSGARHAMAGGCHCGSVRSRMETTLIPESFAPRACDCDYCTCHGAAWVSDALGSLRIQSRDGALQRYRQGSGQAQFLVCARCGVLVAVVACTEDQRWLGAANRNAFDERLRFGPVSVVSPQKLAPPDKLARWTQLWTPVEIVET